MDHATMVSRGRLDSERKPCMRHKSMKAGKRHMPLHQIPSDLYSSFISDLRELLKLDGSFKADYLAREIESKLRSPDGEATDEMRRTRAIDKWLATEVRNAETNQRIMFRDETDFLFLDGSGFPVTAVDVVNWCSESIRRLLGERVNWDELRGSFSGGASTSVRRGVGNIPTKYQEGCDITVGAIYPYLTLTQSVQGMPRDFNVVRGNVLFTVPKTSEIDRVACKEPELNMYCQKAVGDYIRRKLRGVGINLNDQSVNQELARVGSVDGSLATIDLSSASDTVTIQLVLDLLPEEWSSLLMDIRSPETEIDGQHHLNWMMSSMGNAFTFELESLIFVTLVRACAYFTGTRGRISVYGDDIICPSGLKDSVNAVLEYFGFLPNQKKSFWDGAFRESCGKHWLNGAEVTPFYVKSLPVQISDWCLLLNSLRRWASVGGICDPTYWDLWSLYAELIPKPLHGARDCSRRDALVVPYIRNLARIKRAQVRDAAAETRLQRGAYLAWLDATKDRVSPSELTTNHFVYDGVERIARPMKDWVLGVPTFPQEVGVM